MVGEMRYGVQSEMYEGRTASVRVWTRVRQPLFQYRWSLGSNRVCE